MRLLSCFATVLLIVLSAGCCKSSGQTWEDVKTAGRYMSRGVDAVWGKDYESRMLTSDDEFIGPYDPEFLPLSDSDLKSALASGDMALPQPKGIPGQKGIPSLDKFYSPPTSLSDLFRTVHFETDEHAIREKVDLQAMFQLASYLKSHPNVLLVITGHCDERASASYNMALGMRRANAVRGFLVKQGVDMNRVYTVSRGKEDPVAGGHGREDWKLNRRAEFKIYEK